MGAQRSSGIEWTPANIVTIVRICLIPVFILLLLVPWAYPIWGAAAASIQPWCALVVFALISLTDTLDGYLARSRNEVTVFGKFMDPIADKVLVMAALIVLVQIGSVPSWIPIVIIARELLVSGLRMLVASAGVVVAASWIGKAKTATTMVAICLFIVKDTPVLAIVQPWFSIVAWVLMGAAVLLTVASMVDYFARSWPLLTDVPERSSHAPSNEPPARNNTIVTGVEGQHDLARAVVAHATSLGLTVATAESCTGGLVAGALTSIPGSSGCVAGGVVSYSPSVKESVLAVPPSIIENDGVVSEATASAMAQGARTALQADFAVSTTGVAGPGGGTSSTPLGTVCFAVAGPQGVFTETQHFSGSRSAVRAQAVDHALALLIAQIDRDSSASL